MDLSLAQLLRVDRFELTEHQNRKALGKLEAIMVFLYTEVLPRMSWLRMRVDCIRYKILYLARPPLPLLY